MLGGKLTANAAGLTIPHRDEIYAKISSIPEGTLFRAEDIVGDADQWADDFTMLRDYDYMHVVDGWLVGVVETDYLRRSPKLSHILSSYEDAMNCTLTPTGDRTAYEKGYRLWEPLQGYRYYTDGETRLLTIGGLKVRVINSPDWLRDTSPQGELLRVLYDTPEKELHETVARIKASQKISQDDFNEVYALATSISEENDFTAPSNEFKDPTLVTELVQAYLAQKEGHSK
jgi:hypothetical protein